MSDVAATTLFVATPIGSMPVRTAALAGAGACAAVAALGYSLLARGEGSGGAAAADVDTARAVQAAVAGMPRANPKAERGLQAYLEDMDCAEASPKLQHLGASSADDLLWLQAEDITALDLPLLTARKLDRAIDGLRGSAGGASTAAPPPSTPVRRKSATSEPASQTAQLTPRSTRSPPPPSAHRDQDKVARLSAIESRISGFEAELSQWSGGARTPGVLTPDRSAASGESGHSLAPPNVQRSNRAQHASLGSFREASSKSMSQIAAEVGYLHSDLVLLFPVVPSVSFGEEATALHEAGATNLRGEKCRVSRMQTYPQALDVAKASAKRGRVVTAYTLASGLRAMAANLAEAARDRLPIVVHVAIASVDEQSFELSNDAGAVYGLAGSGVVLLNSSGVSDVAATASLAYATAVALKVPVVHFVDGLHASCLTSSAAPTWHEIASISAASQPLGGSELFQYSGDNHADVVFVSVGALAASGARAASLRSLRLGALHVRMLDPWHEADLASQLPQSARHIVVLDYDASSSALGRRMHDMTEHWRQLGLSHLREVHVTQVRASLAEDLDVDRLVGLADRLRNHQQHASSTAPLMLSHLPIPEHGLGHGAAEHKALKFFWSPSAEASQLKHIKHAIADRSDSASYHDCIRKRGSERTMTDLLLNAAPGQPLAHSIRRANIVACYLPSLLDEVDTLASLRDGGIAIFNGPTNLVAAHDVLPPDAAERQLRVFTIDASQGASIAGSNAATVMSLCTVYLSAIQDGHGRIQALAGTKAAFPDIEQEHLEFIILCMLLEHPMHDHMAPRCSSGGRMAKLMCNDPDGGKPALISNRARPVAKECKLDDIECSLDPQYQSPAQATVQLVHREEALKRAVTSPAHSLNYKLRPDLDGAAEFTVKRKERLTSESYERNVFHIELTPKDRAHRLSYKPGQVLNIYPKNQEREVDDFLSDLGSVECSLAECLLVSGQELILRKFETRQGAHMQEMVTLRQYLTNALDIFGCPKAGFYRALAERTKSPMAARLLLTYADNLAEAIAEALTYADVLLRFRDSLKVTMAEIVSSGLIPTMAPRSYSIASCREVVGNQVDLVVVVETWASKLGEEKAGLCSSYLSRMSPFTQSPENIITASVVESTALHLPDATKPVVMIGLGTGIAPFRAFIQKYFHERERKGVHVGDVVLYFGARNSKEEYLYGNELEQYKQYGIVKHLRLAFSRDGPKKVYVQHLIAQDRELLRDLILKQKGYVMMCGPDWPVPTIKKTLKTMDIDLDELVRAGRYLEEVY